MVLPMVTFFFTLNGPMNSSMEVNVNDDTKEYYHDALLSREELHKLYLAKCKDIRQAPAEVLEKRWIDVTMNKCTGFTIDLAESGFGTEAVKELVKILESKKLMRVLNLSRNNFRDSGIRI
jgi:hypothetical protein